MRRKFPQTIASCTSLRKLARQEASLKIADEDLWRKVHAAESKSSLPDFHTCFDIEPQADNAASLYTSDESTGEAVFSCRQILLRARVSG